MTTPITCERCAHFNPNPLNHLAGLGFCPIFHGYNYPGSQRYCREFKERDERQCLPDGWSIEVRENAGKLGLCVFGPTGGFSVDGDTNHSSEIRGEVIAALHAAMQEAGR